jgi:serine phosphatase RsbU (regulator of sigma subunit)
VLVAVLGLAVTAALTFTARAVHDDNEDRLLAQRVREASLGLSSAAASIQTPIASAAVVAEATGGGVAPFELLMAAATGPERVFASASLWELGDTPRRVTLVGVPPKLAGARVAEVGEAARAADGLSVVDLLDLPDARIGFAYAVPFGAPRFLVYAEMALPEDDRRLLVGSGEAFAEVDYAIYLGDSERTRDLLFANTDDLPIHGRRERDVGTFGDTEFTLVMTPHGNLGGSLPGRLPWFIALGGVVLTGATAAMTERLSRRRAHAERLATENRLLYAEQREIAYRLQHSLLPESLPRIPGVALAVSYHPGVEGIDIGGDWYDVIPVDDDRFVLVVGDVSGRGLRAAAVMAALRFATRAYAIQGDAPGVILGKLGGLINQAPDFDFATVLCVVVDLRASRIVVANAGHPHPLLVDASGARYLDSAIGPPVGVTSVDAYPETMHALGPAGTLLAFTDGLFERRGEVLDEGLARVRAVAGAHASSLDDLLVAVRAGAAPGPAEDDTALLAMRWPA